ncbi:double-strand break repair protein AddB [Candidatus Liberibacter africanus]|uniref:Double-strand break repair protein AddB n=1 Tax=Candidatus Liberibacter africanus PTSAPSY TaxID=1277257 RepID=A0A0G3I2P7_LIBAF|nr:double-strand break repair protein AddB [Candidatus Liberibacter africanus]AKK20161.1 double-strand break repair protein AddB [Candidatus Liberibacter africanus PTSAPSY]QTP63959.1 double-strand break repair protein AddB [Candidatus Liberibacter africanus]
MQHKQPNIFTIAPSSPFFKEMIIALLDGKLVENFQYDPSDPLSLASVTIYVPTKRAIQELRSEFIEITGKKSIILPTIKSLGDITEGNFTADLLLSCDLNPPVSNIQRLLELAHLILMWRNKLPNSIKDLYPESPLSLPISPANAIWLAKNLADIIDTIETEEKTWDGLYALQNEQYGMWGLLALGFLKIANQYWTDRLSELNASSPAKYQIDLMHAEEKSLLNEKKWPVIIAGSTGSIPATARLMSTVANNPNGAIVLPGLDFSISNKIWDKITDKSPRISNSNATYSMHPQYSLANLLQFLKIKREDVKNLGKIDEEMYMRSVVISKSFLPSDTSETENTSILDNNILQNIQKYFSDVSLVEADNEREEATAIAVALRMSLDENKKTKSALITADRNLSRRVKLELIRFGIDVDISAGIPLSNTLQNSILTSLLNAVFKPSDTIAIANLIKHPLAKFGFSEKHLYKAKNALELIALRKNTNSYDIVRLKSLVLERIATQQHSSHVPLWQSRLSDEDKDLASSLADHITQSIIPLVTHKNDTLSISDWTKLTANCLQNICFDEHAKLPNLWRAEEGKAISSLFQKIVETSSSIKANAIEWIDIITALIAGETVAPINDKSSNIFILGTLESRLLSFDTVILGGLNEGIWPKHPPKNPFLSRMMQSDLGLEIDEKYIGQASHDFEMASGTRHLIYSRSLRANNIPTIASRWLQRLLVFGGNAFADDLKKKGQCYLDWARNLDNTKKQPSHIRPKPFPPLEIQPKTYSFTEIKTLISDPYAIYAKKILKLDFIPRFKKDPDPRDRGTLFHNIISELIKKGINKNTPEINCLMQKIVDSSFEQENLPPHIDIIWRHLFHKISHSFLEHEEKRQDLIEKSFVNVPAKMKIESVGIHLTGNADRIDLLKSGFVDIIDYKTGNNPTENMARELTDPQLSLEAAALQAGAFTQIDCKKVDNLFYIRLKKKFKEDCITDNNKENYSADALAEKSLSNFIEMITLLQSGKKPFISYLRLPKESNTWSEYDHLARIAEWRDKYDTS